MGFDGDGVDWVADYNAFAAEWMIPGEGLEPLVLRGFVMNYRPHGQLALNNALLCAWRNTLEQSRGSRVAEVAASWRLIMHGDALSGEGAAS